MSRKISLPEDWPVDRQPETLESKLGPFDDHADWQRKIAQEREQRLQDGGYRFVTRVEMVASFVRDHDLPIEEAIECLEYEIRKYQMKDAEIQDPDESDSQ